MEEEDQGVEDEEGAQEYDTMEERPGQEEEYNDGQYEDQQNDQYEAEDQITESG